MTCPDLRSISAGRHRIAHEAPLDEQPTRGATADPWLAMIPTKTGHLFPWGVDTLGVWVEGHRKAMVNRLVAVGCTLRTASTDGTTLLCPVGLFEEVAMITRARKRRRLTAEQRAAAKERLTPFSFAHARQSDFRAPVCPPSPEVDMGAVQAAPAAAG